MVMYVYIRFAGKLVRSGVSRDSDAFVREFIVQLWSVNQRTTEAEEVNDS
jgi:hypothetical protein